MPQECSTPLEVKLPGAGTGRILTYEIAGDPHGVPVFLHHGMPGSSTGPRPRNAVLYRLGVKLISYNRPGYGRSTRWEGRKVADAARDVEFLADYLGHKRFAVMGRSGGGPHALACAALLPHRVVRTAVLVSFAPPDALDLDWYREMVGSNVDAYREATFDRDQLIETLRIRADRTLRNPSHLLDLLRTEMTATDARIVDEVAVHEQLLQNYHDALTDGPFGWIDDVFALRDDWGFKPESVQVPVRLWHGEDDRFAPASHTQWLGDRIPGATLEVQPGAAHFGALPVVPRLLEWLATPAQDFDTAPESTPDRQDSEQRTRTGAGQALGAGTGTRRTPQRQGVLARAVR